jgi:hypothetical protein
MIKISSVDKYIASTTSLRAAMKDYLLLLGEPCPLLGSVAFLLTEFLGGLQPGNECQADTLDNLTSIILRAAILGVVDRLEGLRPESDMCLQSINTCMKISDPLSDRNRCVAFFETLNMAMNGLRRITTDEYPQLFDDTGKLMTGR